MEFDPESTKENEWESGAHLKDEVIKFLSEFPAEDSRDPYYVAELIFSIPSEEIKKWVKESATQKLQVAIKNHRPDLEANIATITESLKMIKKSMLKLEEHNQKLIQKWKEKRRDTGGK